MLNISIPTTNRNIFTLNCSIYCPYFRRYPNPIWKSSAIICICTAIDHLSGLISSVSFQRYQSPRQAHHQCWHCGSSNMSSASTLPPITLLAYFTTHILTHTYPYGILWRPLEGNQTKAIREFIYFSRTEDKRQLERNKKTKKKMKKRTWNKATRDEENEVRQRNVAGLKKPLKNRISLLGLLRPSSGIHFPIFLFVTNCNLV